MKISIVTPSFNQANFLQQTLESVLNQKGDFELEYFVMDGGSTDNSVDVLKKYEERFKKGDFPKVKKFEWISEKDKGQSDAINKGLRKTTGEIVAYLNSDDLYQPEALQTVVDFFKKNKNAKWCSGKCEIINEKNQPIRKWISWYKNFLLKKLNYQKLLAENPISQPATFWKRELHTELGYFDETEHLVMDYEFWLRIGEKHTFHFLPQKIAAFRWYETSKSGLNYKKQFLRELEIAKKYAQKIQVKWPIWKHQVNVWKIVGIYNLLNFNFLKK